LPSIPIQDVHDQEQAALVKKVAPSLSLSDSANQTIELEEILDIDSIIPPDETTSISQGSVNSVTVSKASAIPAGEGHVKQGVNNKRPRRFDPPTECGICGKLISKSHISRK
jgi:hypothetical protein